MKKFLAVLILTFLVTVGAQSADFIFACHGGMWTQGTNAGQVNIIFNNGNVVTVEKLDATNGVGAYAYFSGPYLEKAGGRTFSFQTESVSCSGVARNGVVIGTFKNFKTGVTGSFKTEAGVRCLH